MKVVCFSFVDSGGMLHYIENLANGLEEVARTSVVILSKVGPHVVSEKAVRIQWAKHHLVSKLFQMYNPWFYKCLANRICSQLNPDVVHIGSRGIGLLSFVSSFTAAGVKVVYTVHDPIPHEERTTFWGRCIRTYQFRVQLPKVIQRCSAVHVHSNKHVRDLERLYGARRVSNVYVVPHGAGLTPRISEGSGFPKELVGTVRPALPTVLFFGRIETYKGLPLLAASIRLLEQVGTHINLIVAGEGRLSEDCFAGLLSNVSVINRFIDDSEISSIFKLTDVVVLPYLSATQSGVIPLAYSFGKPVVATDVGAMSELVRHDETGLLVQAGDCEALSSALATLLSDEAYRTRLGANARRYMLETLSWSTVAREHYRRYSELMAHTGRSDNDPLS